MSPPSKKPPTGRQTSGAMRATPPPSEKGYTQYSFQLPRYYLDVLEKEAAYLSHRRSPFLELLVLRKLGRFSLERSPSAPKHKPPKREDLVDQDRFVWHMRPEIKVMFDNLRLKMGDIPPKSWIILA